MKPAPIHLLLGPDEGNKKDFIRSLVSAIENRDGQVPERLVMYAGEQSIGDAVALLRTGSLFHPHQVVIFHGADSIKSAEDQKILQQYSRSPSAEGTLILLSLEQKVPAKVEGCVPKSNVKIFWEMFANQKEQFVIRRLASARRKIERDGLLLLLESIEGTSDQLAIYSDRLISLFPPEHIITEEDIDSFLFHSKQESVFSLFRAVSERKLERALEILHTLLVLQEMKSFQLIAGVSWQLRRLLSIKERLQRGMAQDQIWSDLKIRGKKNREQLLQACRNYSLAELQDRLRLVSQVDTALRSEKSGVHDHLMHLFVFRFVRGS